MTLQAPDSVFVDRIPSQAAAASPAAAPICRTTLLARLRGDDSGQDLIEYALAAAMIGLTAVSSMAGLANNISNTFDDIGNSLASAAFANAAGTGAQGNNGGPTGGTRDRRSGGFGGGFGDFDHHH